MDKYEPEDYCENEIANAIMNVAAELRFVGQSIDSLLYGLKYSKMEGMSIAEALEVGAGKIAESIGMIEFGNQDGSVAEALEAGSKQIAESISNLDPSNVYR